MEGDDVEWLGFGHGDGEVSGEIQGKLAWANYSRRRQDGVWTPTVRGGTRRAILARVELTTEAEESCWLNTSFLVGEGEMDTSRRSPGSTRASA